MGDPWPGNRKNLVQRGESPSNLPLFSGCNKVGRRISHLLVVDVRGRVGAGLFDGNGGELGCRNRERPG